MLEEQTQCCWHRAYAEVRMWSWFSTPAASLLPLLLYLSQACSAAAQGCFFSSVHSKVRRQATLLFSFHSTASGVFAGVLGSLHTAGHDSWISVLAVSCWDFSLVPLTLLLLSFPSFLKPIWQHYCFGLCPLAAGLVSPAPKGKKPRAPKYRSSKLASPWTKHSLWKLLEKKELVHQKTKEKEGL